MINQAVIATTQVMIPSIIKIHLQLITQLDLGNRMLGAYHLPSNTGDAFHLHETVCKNVGETTNTDREEIEAT